MQRLFLETPKCLSFFKQDKQNSNHILCSVVAGEISAVALSQQEEIKLTLSARG